MDDIDQYIKEELSKYRESKQLDRGKENGKGESVWINFTAMNINITDIKAFNLGK